MTRPGRRTGRGFSLVELVIVIVIIGVIAAIAIPRVSRGARGAGESALRSNLAILRSAIELYASEHDGKFPASGSTDAAAFADQLLKYTDIAGNTSDTKVGDYKYGPYLRKQIPAAPIGSKKGESTVKVVNADSLGTPDGSTAWLYSSKTGEIILNAPDTETDESNKAYNTY